MRGTDERGTLLGVLPRQRYVFAVEPGCAVGLLTVELARRCDRVGYYLDAAHWRQVVDQAAADLEPGGHLVACHWRHPALGFRPAATRFTRRCGRPATWCR